MRTLIKCKNLTPSLMILMSKLPMAASATTLHSMVTSTQQPSSYMTHHNAIIVITSNIVHDSLQEATICGHFSGKHSTHNCHCPNEKECGEPIPCVRYQIADGSLTTPFCSTPLPLYLCSPSPTHLHPISTLSLTPLHSSLFPLVLLSCPCFPVWLISVSNLP